MNIPQAKTLESNSALKAIAWLFAMIFALVLMAPAMSPKAFATDMTPASAAGQTSRFFRIALNKTAVVTLPGDAKDVVVGNNDIVDVVVRNKNTAYLFARKNGSTNVFFFDANGQQIMSLDLEVAVDVLALQNLIRRTIPGTHITVDVLGANVVLAGTAMNPQEAKIAVDLASEYIGVPSTTVSSVGGITTTTQTGGGLIVNTIKIAGEDQVMLQVKIVEMQRDIMKQWGVNIGAMLNTGLFAFNIANINPFVTTPLQINGGYSGMIGDASNNMTGVIHALENDGMLHMLAEPNLTAVSGQAASFKAGGEFPYQTCTGEGTDPLKVSNVSKLNCSVQFKEYGVGLDFTPTVLSAGRIHLKIHTAVSELTQTLAGTTTLITTSGVPSLNVRAADTVLEMPDGGSMMLAGLIREQSRQYINGTPGLKAVPILGALFRSREFISNQTELVVLVTPHIVRSTAQKELETPDKNFNMATDQQTMMLGRLNKLYGGCNCKSPKGKYHGNIGYIVE